MNATLNPPTPPTRVHDPAKASVAFDHAVMLRGVQVPLLDPFEVEAASTNRGVIRRSLAGVGSVLLRLTRPEKYVGRGMRRELAEMVHPSFRSLVLRITDAEVLYAFALYRQLTEQHIIEMVRASVHDSPSVDSFGFEGAMNARSTPRHNRTPGGAGGGVGGGGGMTYAVKPGGRLPGILGGEPVGRARTTSTPVEI